MKPGGPLLILVGVWVVSQVLGGQVLQRLGIIGGAVTTTTTTDTTSTGVTSPANATAGLPPISTPGHIVRGQLGIT